MGSSRPICQARPSSTSATRGYRDDVVPIVPAAIGVELDYPGYDGVTLPFAEGSQDAVFTSHCLEHIEDFQNAIRDWFRVLRYGGYLLIMVPHQFLYEKQTALPSRYNEDHKRFYTPASLMAEIETSLRPNTYRVRHLRDNDARYDYSIPPYRHAGGSYELEVVIEKIRPPSWDLAEPSAQPPPPKETTPAKPGGAAIGLDQIVKPRQGGSQPIRVIQTGGDPALLYDFGTHLPAKLQILVLKLDHLGDFIIGTPGLQRVREAFPAAHIRLVVGSWNRVAAEASGLANEVVVYNYFPQHSRGWDGKPHERVEKFHALTTGRYDIAIDLRVDEDTRWLLAGVEAGLRCGIGSRTRHPFLDVVLPPEHAARADASSVNLTDMFIKPSEFESVMPFRHAFCHETDFRPIEGHIIYGPYVRLPRGHFKVIFDLQLTGWQVGLKNTNVTLDISRDGQEIGIAKRLRTQELKALAGDGAALSFENTDPDATYEFRVHITGQPRQTRLRFGGVRLEHVESVAPARFRRAELHIGEQLSLLVQLVLDRTQDLYRETALPAPPRDAAAAARQIAIAPFSNSNLRDWPFKHYVKLIRLLLDRLDCSIILLGSQPQAAELDRMVEAAGGGARIRNLGGKTAWAEMPGLLRQADLVICNNSGIAHLAASGGALTLAIYSASHQPQEWGPRGRQSHALMSVVPCSPCGHDRLDECPHEHRCMEGLVPETVFAEAAALLSGTASASLAAPLGTLH